MPYLPPDVVEEILSRLPATSVKRLTSTCKRWNALYKDPRFTEKHFCKAAKQCLVLILKEFKVFLMSVTLNVAPPTIEFKGPLGLKDSYNSNLQQVDIIQVFHCSGLLLCTTKNNRLMVWNPCLGETRWVRLTTGYMSYSKFALGYENKLFCHSYKILRYSEFEDPNQGVVGSEIYELSSDSWRVLDDLTLKDCYTVQNGVSLKGNTFLLSLDKRDKSILLLGFNFTTEKYRRLGLLPFQSPGFMDLSVVREEEISVLFWRFDSSKIDIWVTIKIDTEAAVLWRKSFTVDLNIHRTRFPFCVTFVIDEEKKVVVICNAGFETSRKKMIYVIGEDHECYTEFPFVKSTSKTWYPLIFNYVPSLVRIQQGIIETDNIRE